MLRTQASGASNAASAGVRKSMPQLRCMFELGYDIYAKRSCSQTNLIQASSHRWCRELRKVCSQKSCCARVPELTSTSPDRQILQTVAVAVQATTRPASMKPLQLKSEPCMFSQSEYASHPWLSWSNHSMQWWNCLLYIPPVSVLLMMIVAYPAITLPDSFCLDCRRLISISKENTARTVVFTLFQVSELEYV
jgi:hypothetical protein